MVDRKEVEALKLSWAENPDYDLDPAPAGYKEHQEELALFEKMTKRKWDLVELKEYVEHSENFLDRLNRFELLTLHETVELNGFFITRVVGGWLYENTHGSASKPSSSVFIPFVEQELTEMVEQSRQEKKADIQRQQDDIKLSENQINAMQKQIDLLAKG